MKSQVPHPHPNKGRTPGLSSLSLRPRSVATAVLRTLQDHEEQTLSFQSSLVVVAKGHSKNHNGWSSLNISFSWGGLSGAPLRSTTQVSACRHS